MPFFGKKKPDEQQPAPAPKRRKGFLKRAFSTAAKSVLGGALLFGSYQYYTPPKFKTAVNEQIDHVNPLLNIHKPRATAADTATAPSPAQAVLKEKLAHIFEDKAAPVVLNVQTLPQTSSYYGMPAHWVAMMGRQDMAMRNPENAQTYFQWMSQLDKYKDASVWDKARAVDALVDKDIKYQSDETTYGRDEYWASPLEIITARQGDCEDFAILKYYALRYLGVEPDRLYVIVVGDKPGSDLNHATLLVNVAKAPKPAQNDNMLPGTDGLNLPAIPATTQKPAPVRFVVIEDDDTPQGLLLEPMKLGYHPYFAMNEKAIWYVPEKPKKEDPPAPKTPTPPKTPPKAPPQPPAPPAV